MSGFGNSGKQIRRIREVTQDITPAGDMRITPFETFKMGGGVKREQAGNVRYDRQPADNPAIDLETTGSAAADFVHADYDGLLEEAMCNLMAAAQSVSGGTIEAVAAGNIIRHGTTGSWVNFVDGDIVYVTGFVTNGAAFVARVNGTPAGFDLVLDANFKTLVNEAIGPTVTVMHAGRFRLGTSMLTATYEEWHVLAASGYIYRGIGVTSYGLDVPHPNRIKQSFGLRGISTEPVSAQLANASLQPSGNPALGSTTNFGDGGNPTFGFGLRWGGTLLSNLRLKSLKLSIENPQLAEGAAGSLGPIDISLDGVFTVKVDITFLKVGANAATMIADAFNDAAQKALGFGYRDNAGKRGYWYLPALQPADGMPSGLQQSGRDTFDVSLVGKYDAVHSMLQYTKLDA